MPSEKEGILFHVFSDEIPPWYLGLYEAENEAIVFLLSKKKHPERTLLRIKRVPSVDVEMLRRYCTINRTPGE